MQLRDEVSMVAKVTQYFGPLGLQQPFGAAGVGALANLSQISHEIQEAVEPPPARQHDLGRPRRAQQILIRPARARPKTRLR